MTSRPGLCKVVGTILESADAMKNFCGNKWKYALLQCCWLRLAMMLCGIASLQGQVIDAQSPESAKADFFESRIRPVLVDRCYSCHSVSAEKLKGELHLDSLSGLLTGGETGPAIIPGKPDKSRLIIAIRYEDIDLEMPPKGKLTDQQIKDFEIWVASGAFWPGSADAPKSAAREKFNIEQRKQEHWGWQPVKKPAIPPVKDKSWSSNAIDQFVLSELEKDGISPAEPAGKRELLRRITFDMIGLPPTEKEMEAFLKDTSPDAYTKVVERLLDSSHYGEKWARHWLDLVRYAETFGHEFDYPILNAWRYRDYVIRAFNENVPYDQFLREHIAGDLLAKPRMNGAGENESIQATAFYWLGQQVHSPVDVRGYQLERIDNQIDVLTKAFQGMTVSCARCHDHKFDAISTKDYYSMFSIIASSRYASKSIVAPARNEDAIKEMTSIKSEVDLELKKALATLLPESRRYIAAVREAHFGKPGLEESRDAKDDVVFEDFESGTYQGWSVIGRAFGDSPHTQQTVGSYQGDLAAVGKYFVNSHNTRGGQDIATGDALTGKMTSRAFTIDKDHIHMLVGGGSKGEKTSVRLLVGDKVVRTMAGKESNRMSPAVWNAADLKGQRATIEIIDEGTGGWGNIGLDHIVFSNRPKVFGPDNQPLREGRNIEVVAKEHGLDALKLAKWVASADEAPPEVKNVFYAADNGAKTVKRDGQEQTVVFARGNDFKKWLTDGEAFGYGNYNATGAVLLGTNSNNIAFTEPGMHSAGLSRKLEGAARSPSFIISKPYIHVRHAGSDSRLNIVINGFTLIRAPIYGDLKIYINRQEPAWQTVDVSMWQGRECYLEYLDQTAFDTSDGKSSYSSDAWFSVHEVIFSDSKNTPETFAKSTAEGLPFLALNWMIKTGLLNIGSAELERKLNQIAATETKLAPAIYVASITDGDGFDDHVFVRGNHKTLGEKAPRAYLEGLNCQPEKFAKGSGRLQLAEELLSESNPFTARVRVNWLWKHLFGQGLVASIDNFGVLGEQPTHPELLDFLATEYRNSGWDTKKMLRMMALSRAYQMSSQLASSLAEEKDTTNKLLSRARVRRLDGELIRDAILAVSGSLKREMSGKPVPIHLTPFMEGRGKPDVSGPLDGDGRRTIYVEVRRNFLSPLTLAFDGPIPFTTVGKRSISNVPAQALILMNDPFVLQEARRWSERLVMGKTSETIEERVRRMYSVALGRNPAPHETAAATEFLRGQSDLYQIASADLMRNVDVWADFAHVMFNLKEFVFIN